ncbi:MAG TPA: TIGR03617 family F420-dependent LLM class oxidoreductase [Acidimicrobiia bacterium]|nr:TIGR03617 family F420-dependent LLM class oxidoreductase [Acidimicrobiia bacterium]
MKVDYYFPPALPLGAAAAADNASRLGYDGFFTAETAHDPFLPLVMAASAAPGLDLGTSIAVAFPRSPMSMAMLAWDLAAVSEGRFILGLGTQVKAHITRRFSQVWDRPAPRLADYIRAMRAIWDTWQNGTPLRYEGDFYQFSLMTPFFNPGPIDHPNVPVAIAGVGPYLSRLAGELCQGFHVHPFHTVAYLDQVVLPNIASGAEEAGRALSDCDRITTVFVVTGRTQEEMEQAMGVVKQQIAFYASTPSYAPVLEASGWDFGPKLTAMSKRGEWAEMAQLISDDVVAEVGIVAPIEDLADAVHRRYGDRVQRVGFYTLGPGQMLEDDALAQVIADVKRPR